MSGHFRRGAALAGILATVLVIGCGGGGSTVAAGGGGTGGSGGGGSGDGSTPNNVASIIVDGGPALAPEAVNTPYVSVTLCASGTTNCQTIDHITVDTGSSGFRVIASVLTPTLAAALAQEMDAQGRPIVECLQFADGYSWGPVKTADLKIAGESASNVPIHVIGDSSFPTAPAACSNGVPTAENSVPTFGANGILGISVFQQDCGPGCVTTTDPNQPFYFVCPSGGACTPTTATLAQQVPNPVFSFAAPDNNGTIIQLPSVSNAGAATLTGSLTFGIDSEANNAIGTATVLTVDPDTGNFPTAFNGQTYSESFLDSGSNGNFFTDAAIPTCQSTSAKGFFCPASTVPLSAVNTSFSSNTVTSTVQFSVANAETLFSSNNGTLTAFNNLGGPIGTSGAHSFDFGVPFFLGRKVYTAHENHSTSAGPGPFVAY